MKIKRILIFNVNWLGDVLFSTATIRNIRHNFPDSFMACIVPSRCYSILKENPYLNEIIIFDEDDRHKSILEKLKFVQFLKEKNFDVVFLLHRSFSRALISRLASIPERIGYSTKKRAFLLTKKIPLPTKDSLHRIDYYLNLIERLGLQVEDRYTDFFISDEDIKYVEDFLSKQGVVKICIPNHQQGQENFLVGINPGGNWLPKRWPKELWASLSDKLISDFDAKLIITGAIQDVTLAKEIQDLMQEIPLITCGIFNLKQLGALCKRLDLFITADSGPLHIANAVGTKKIISLFGPTSPSITGPYPLKNITIIQKDVGCQIPCYIVHCKDNRCMKAITPEEVITEVRKIIAQKKK